MHDSVKKLSVAKSSLQAPRAPLLSKTRGASLFQSRSRLAVGRPRSYPLAVEAAHAVGIVMILLLPGCSDP